MVRPALDQDRAENHEVPWPASPYSSTMDSQPSADDVRPLLRRVAAIAEYEDDGRWAIVRELQRRTDRTAFDAVYELAGSADTLERMAAVDVLAQIGYLAERPFHDETLPLLIDASQDTDADVIAAAVTALGFLRDPRTLPAILSHAGHPSANVRYAVAFAIPGAAGDPPSPHAIEALIALSADPDGETRDWATFGLGSQFEDEDSDAIRDALAARLDDPDGDTSGEALLGLALRHDPRALPVLLACLDDDPGNLIVEAAAALGAPEALPDLERLKREGWQLDEPRPSVLDDALRACAAEDAGWLARDVRPASRVAARSRTSRTGRCPPPRTCRSPGR
jgi:HEAT repeat protein